MDQPRILLLTGASRVGKTTVCRRVIEMARERGLAVLGVITEDVGTVGGGALKNVVDLESGQVRRLATATAERARVLTVEDGTPSLSDLELLRRSWVFDKEGVALGNRALRRAVSNACDVLVVDEIGPL